MDMFGLTHRKYALSAVLMLAFYFLSAAISINAICLYPLATELDVINNTGCVIEAILNFAYLVTLGVWFLATVIVAHSELRLILVERKTKKSAAKVLKEVIVKKTKKSKRR